jgi:hypothetical protein
MLSMLMMALAGDLLAQPKFGGCNDWSRPIVTGLKVK